MVTSSKGENGFGGGHIDEEDRRFKIMMADLNLFVGSFLFKHISKLRIFPMFIHLL